MTVITGATLGAESFQWNDTFCDRSVALPNGEDIVSIGVYSDAAQSVVVKILEESSPTSMTVVVSETLPHPGGGFADLTLSQAFTVPPSGTYRMGAHVNGTINGSVSAPRASKSGNATGTGTFFSVDAPQPVLRASTTGSTPPPPPPASGSEYCYLFAGQSNGNALAQTPAFLARMSANIPGATHQVVNAAGDSTYIAPPNFGEQHWQPTPGDGFGTLCQQAAALRDAAIAGGATLAAVVWYQGEAQTRADLEATVLHYPEYLRATLGAISLPNVPVIVIELHEQPDSTYPLWPHMQFVQRQTGEGGFFGIDNVTVVSAADLSDSIDDGLHLSPTDLSTLAERVADAITAKIWPR